MTVLVADLGPRSKKEGVFAVEAEDLGALILSCIPTRSRLSFSFIELLSNSLCDRAAWIRLLGRCT